MRRRVRGTPPETVADCAWLSGAPLPWQPSSPGGGEVKSRGKNS